MGKSIDKIKSFYNEPNLIIEFDTPQNEEWIRLVSKSREQILMSDKQ